MLEVSMFKLRTSSSSSSSSSLPSAPIIKNGRLNHLRIKSPALTMTSSLPKKKGGADSKGEAIEKRDTSATCCPAMSRDELKKKLTPLQYQITQEKGTERAFTGKYNKMKEGGMFDCVVCGERLFSSDTKYDSGSGWPAFYDVLDTSKVKLKQDLSHVGGNLLLLAMNPGLVRTEVSCARCQAHLGHLFDDGPKPTGKRFCINSAALNFSPSGKTESDRQQESDVIEQVTCPKTTNCCLVGNSSATVKSQLK